MREIKMVLWVAPKRTRYTLGKASAFHRALQVHLPQGRAQATMIQPFTANSVDMDENMITEIAFADCPRTLAVSRWHQDHVYTLRRGKLALSGNH